jgi:hypothetical protein
MIKKTAHRGGFFVPVAGLAHGSVAAMGRRWPGGCRWAALAFSPVTTVGSDRGVLRQATQALVGVWFAYFLRDRGLLTARRRPGSLEVRKTVAASAKSHPLPFGAPFARDW